MKTALITGSTSGIGEGIARQLSKTGVRVMLHGFGDEKYISQLCQEFSENSGAETLYSNADVSSPAAIEKMIASANSEMGKIDILVNNAGIQHVDAIENFPAERWDAVIAVNLSAAFHAIRLTVKGMKERNFGRIINIASAHGLVASANKSAYVAAKHGLVGLTKVVALENAKLPITCNAICPGWVLTPLVQKQIDAIALRDSISVVEAEKKLLSEKQPAERFVTPEQLGDLAVFLCGDSASVITGASWSVDGGWTAQ